MIHNDKMKTMFQRDFGNFPFGKSSSKIGGPIVNKLPQDRTYRFSGVPDKSDFPSRKPALNLSSKGVFENLYPRKPLQGFTSKELVPSSSTARYINAQTYVDGLRKSTTITETNLGVEIRRDKLDEAVNELKKQVLKSEEMRDDFKEGTDEYDAGNVIVKRLKKDLIDLQLRIDPNYELKQGIKNLADIFKLKIEDLENVFTRPSERDIEEANRKAREVAINREEIRIGRIGREEEKISDEDLEFYNNILFPPEFEIDEDLRRERALGDLKEDIEGFSAEFKGILEDDILVKRIQSQIFNLQVLRELSGEYPGFMSDPPRLGRTAGGVALSMYGSDEFSSFDDDNKAVYVDILRINMADRLLMEYENDEKVEDLSRRLRSLEIEPEDPFSNLFLASHNEEESEQLGLVFSKIMLEDTSNEYDRFEERAGIKLPNRDKLKRGDISLVDISDRIKLGNIGRKRRAKEKQEEFDEKEFEVELEEEFEREEFEEEELDVDEKEVDEKESQGSRGTLTTANSTDSFRELDSLFFPSESIVKPTTGKFSNRLTAMFQHLNNNDNIGDLKRGELDPMIVAFRKKYIKPTSLKTSASRVAYVKWESAFLAMKYVNERLEPLPDVVVDILAEATTKGEIKDTVDRINDSIAPDKGRRLAESMRRSALRNQGQR
jgi:hypothetical protein